ncbi:hypothetical protein A9Q78_06550 [Methylophaga sp. 41_12_T18]|nr:hypothetical protein A9Q78_06550 [Methylophaga sp. 41_12_T18]
MKLFVYEHITSGALTGQDLPQSLAHEGDAMLTAILQDLAEIPQLELVILRDVRLQAIAKLNNDISLDYLWVSSSSSFDQQWQQALSIAEHSLLIAPETEQQLISIQQQVIDSGKRYLGCSQHATALTTDKLDCFQLLTSHGITTPTTKLATDWHLADFNYATSFIVKPVDGAGCIDTMHFQTPQQVSRYLEQQPEPKLSKLIVQPFIVGEAASLSLFIDETVSVLALNGQQISQQGSQLICTSSNTNNTLLAKLPLNQAQELVDRIFDIIPGLWGFVGIDLILSASGPVVIEINPRLTTSYLNLKSTLTNNPAELLINAIPKQIASRFAS